MLSGGDPTRLRANTIGKRDAEQPPLKKRNPARERRWAAKRAELRAKSNLPS